MLDLTPPARASIHRNCYGEMKTGLRRDRGELAQGKAKTRCSCRRYPARTRTQRRPRESRAQLALERSDQLFPFGPTSRCSDSAHTIGSWPSIGRRHAFEGPDSAADRSHRRPDCLAGGDVRHVTRSCPASRKSAGGRSTLCWLRQIMRRTRMSDGGSSTRPRTCCGLRSPCRTNACVSLSRLLT